MAAVQSQSFTPTPDLEAIQAQYTVGQDQYIHTILQKRTAEHDAAFLLPYIKPDSKVLDVGCGPGTITADFAALVPQGDVTGFDASAAALEKATANANKRGLKNINFMLGDATKLPFPDNTFDIAYSHQVLIHCPLPIPVAIMREIHRVLKPGGVYGDKEADVNTTEITPPMPAMAECYRRYGKLLAIHGSEPEAGKVNGKWAIEAGFQKEKVKHEKGFLIYVDGHERWSLKHQSKQAREMVEHKVVTAEEMDYFRDAWLEFENMTGPKRFGLGCGEAICVK